MHQCTTPRATSARAARDSMASTRAKRASWRWAVGGQGNGLGRWGAWLSLRHAMRHTMSETEGQDVPHTVVCTCPDTGSHHADAPRCFRQFYTFHTMRTHRAVSDSSTPFTPCGRTALFQTVPHRSHHADAPRCYRQSDGKPVLGRLSVEPHRSPMHP
eukprot:359154-Chlamydomonas_euryale.AAC.5